ncbi:MAG TPA: NADPH-dependent FMN reductase [Candidatus Limnocylindrales bacterium]|nr:NADPH-dependent FMN reductase [Candidatus Limnocylindrales bacterium]
MPTILGLSGSLRRNSYNTMLLQAAAELAPAGCTVEIGSIDGIPLYNGDLEESDYPAAAAALKDRVAACDGLLLVTPEYNYGVPGVFKNAIDWLTRPPTDIPRVFHDRRVALMGATPGNSGTMNSQQAWLNTLRVLKTRPYFGSYGFVSSCHKAFDEQGKLTDEKVRKQVQGFMAGFAEFCSK